jgi:hypothetical protein
MATRAQESAQLKRELEGARFAGQARALANTALAQISTGYRLAADLPAGTSSAVFSNPGEATQLLTGIRYTIERLYPNIPANDRSPIVGSGWWDGSGSGGIRSQVFEAYRLVQSISDAGALANTPQTLVGIFLHAIGDPDAWKEVAENVGEGAGAAVRTAGNVAGGAVGNIAGGLFGGLGIFWTLALVAGAAWYFGIGPRTVRKVIGL